MVSVPCVITTPRYPSEIALPTRSAMVAQCSGVMFSLSMLKRSSVSRLAISPSPGTLEYRSSGLKIGVTAPVL